MSTPNQITSEPIRYTEAEERIAACLSACTGIDTALLAGMTPGFLATLPDRHLAERKELNARVAELKAALLSGVIPLAEKQLDVVRTRVIFARDDEERLSLLDQLDGGVAAVKFAKEQLA